MPDEIFPESQPKTLLAMLEIAIDAIVAFDEGGKILIANPSMTSMFGFSRDELIGQEIQSLIAGEAHQSDQVNDQQLKDKIASSQFMGMKRQLTGLTKLGDTFPISLAVKCLEIDDKQLFVATVRDDTHLNERQARLEAIMKNAVDPIITIDERGIIDSANPATEEVFGYATAELIGRNINMLMPAPYKAEHNTYLKNYCQTGIAKIIGIGREVTGLRKDGTIFPVSLAVSEIRLGPRRLFTGMIRDITELKKTEKMLAQLNGQLEQRVQRRTEELRETQAELVRNEKFSTLGKVSGGIAHEIRNPLNAIKTSAYYLLNASNATAEKSREHLERIDRQVVMIDNVVTALSDVAKLPEARLQSLKLDSFSRSALATFDVPANVSVEFDFADSLPMVLADGSQLMIALLNLLRNARDAMPEGGVLTVGGQCFPDYVALSVSDTGIGISEKDLANVLEPLFTTKARGMGLGLPITKAIVEKNKGTLHITSTPGEGSRFTIRLTQEP